MRSANFNSWSDFKQYGINCLTGESCALGMRLLCDLSEEGRTLMAQFFGLSGVAAFSENWNSKVGEAPAVASIMLPRGLFNELARYIAFRVLGHAHVVVMADGTVHSYAAGYMEDNHLTLDEAKKLVGGNWFHNHASAASIDGRNVHAASGRVA